MPWSPEHKKQTRDKILTSASRLFTHQGFDKVSIDQVMQEAGMTRGAFYKHFSSKSELYSEAIIYASTRRAGLQLTEAASLQEIIDLYLSRDHLDNEGDVCPLAFLVSDITQRDPLQQETYAKVLKGFIKLMARAAGDRELSDQILNAARAETQHQLGCSPEQHPMSAVLCE